jgi:hypothetical protein
MPEPICSCKPNQVNARVARANAFFTLVMALIFIFTPLKWIIYVLLIDFALKVFFGPKASPFTQFNIRLMRWLKIKPKHIFAPPKKFALKVGLIFSLAVLVLYLSDLTLAANIVAGVLSLFAALELFFEFCMGCWVYYLFNTVKNETEA